MKNNLKLLLLSLSLLGFSACDQASNSNAPQPAWVQEHATLPDGQVLSALSESQKTELKTLIESLSAVNRYVISFQNGSGYLQNSRDFDSIQKSQQFALEIASCRKTQNNQSFSINGNRCHTEFRRHFHDTNSKTRSEIEGQLHWKATGSVAENFDVQRIAIQASGLREIKQTNPQLQTGQEDMRSSGTVVTRTHSWTAEMLLNRKATNSNQTFWNEDTERKIILKSNTSVVFFKEVLKRTPNKSEVQYFLNGSEISDLEANSYLNVLRFYLF